MKWKKKRVDVDLNTQLMLNLPTDVDVGFEKGGNKG